jgi:signal transduction histidine kinase
MTGDAGQHGDGGAGDGPDEELARLRHAVRTPLAIVLGFAELLDRATVDDATRRDYAQRITEAGIEIRELLDGQ